MACGRGPALPQEPEPPALRWVEVAAGLDAPVFVAAPPGDTARLFVVEQTGRIRVLRQGALLPRPFLDLSGVVRAGGEQGLLGLAFHPDYARTREFFVNYTDLAGDTRVVRYRASAADPEIADPNSGTVLLAVDQPFANHNGGMLAFGPDGFLYIALGDGGSGYDPLGHGQNRATLLGSLLRVDVDGGTPYGIPPDNPFVGDPDARPEIWAYGLRNPWRFSFDRETGDLYIGDVGQDAREEIDVEPAGSPGGRNYGWAIVEGTRCVGAATCDTAGLVPPTLEYPRADGACAVIGGYAYRGSRIPALRGTYFYSDFCAGFVRSFRYEDGRATELRDWPELAVSGGASSFGEDARGELYLVTLDGRVRRLEPAP